MEKVTLKERAFVDSVAGKEQMPFFHFEPGTGWNEGVLSALQKLNELEKKKTEFYVYEVLLLLSKNMAPDLQKHLYANREKEKHYRNSDANILKAY